MDLNTTIILTLGTLLLSALFSGCEMAYVTSDRVRVELDVKKGGLIASIINVFYAHAQMFISTLLVGNNIVLVIYGMGAAAMLTPWLESFTDSEFVILLLQTLISTGVILITGEFLPKTIFGINPNNSLKIFALPVFVFYVLLYPVSWLTMLISKGLMRLAGIRDTARALHLITVGELGDYLEETIDDLQEKKQTVENEVKIFRNALDFSTTHVRDCMTPRNEIVAADIDTTDRDQLVALFTSTGRSKIIVYRDDIDTILGYIHVSELFDPAADWREHLKPVIYAPENLLANTMMRRLLQQKRSIAVIVDEFGGTAGMLTLEDLMEEICGNIEDEHDKNGLTAKCIAPGVYEFSGRCEIEEINERFDLDIPEDDAYQTIAGYILHTTGTIPAQGETLVVEPYRMDILKKSANRLELIRLATMQETENKE